MKKSELSQLIREEIQKVLREETTPTFRDRKGKAFYEIALVALKNNKVKEFQQTLEDYGVELSDVDFNLATTNKIAFMKQLEDSINFSDWDAVSWGDIKNIHTDLGF